MWGGVGECRERTGWWVVQGVGWVQGDQDGERVQGVGAGRTGW